MKTLSATCLLSLLVACGSNPEASTPEGSSEASGSSAAAEVSAPVPDAPPAATASSVAPATTISTAAANDAPAPAKTKRLTLADAGLPLSLEAPEDAKVEKSSSKDGLGGARIESSSLSVRVMKADARLSTTAAAKATLQKMVKPARSFSKEEKDLLVYTRGESDFAFVVLKKIGAVTYACQSLGGANTEAELERAIAACRSLDKSP